MSQGSKFQVVAAATEKARRARSVLVLGTTSSRASDDPKYRTGIAYTQQKVTPCEYEMNGLT